MPVLVLMTGTGRSGTRTMSGTLHHLGLSVPGPHLQGNESNPRGLFENKWSVKFHNALNERAGVNLFDSRPSALARVQAAVTRRDRRRLREFLTKHHLEVPGELQQIAQSVWDEMMVLRESGGVDSAASERIDSLAVRYSRLFRDAAAISHDATQEANARTQGEREALKRMSAKSVPLAETRSLEDRPVGQVGGRDLIRVIGQRAARKVRPAR